MLARIRRFIRRSKTRLRVIGYIISNSPEFVRSFQVKLLNTYNQLEQLKSQVLAVKGKAIDAEKQALFVRIGQALTVWSNIEELLVQIFSLLLRTPTNKSGLILFSILNFNVWLSLIHDMFELDQELRPFQKRWNKISERLRTLKDNRDRLAHHSVVGAELEERGRMAFLTASRYDTRSKTKRQQPLSVLEVGDFLRSVQVVFTDLLNLTEEMTTAFEASLERRS